MEEISFVDGWTKVNDVNILCQTKLKWVTIKTALLFTTYSWAIWLGHCV